MQTYYFKECDVWLPYPEEWKPIKDFDGFYDISNYGRVKSLARNILMPFGGFRKQPEIILKYGSSNGYKTVLLCKNKKVKTAIVHHLVWDHFGDKPRNKRKLQIDHKDNIKIHNWITNFQLLTSRQNITKYQKTKNNSSKYDGVSWRKDNKKWVVSITINCKRKHLGCFLNEYDAHLMYESELVLLKCIENDNKELKNGNSN